MTAFKVGDNVRSLYDGGYLIKGQQYTVESISNGFLEVHGVLGTYTENAFKLSDKKQPHKHAEVIKAWADGEKIEYFNTLSWRDTQNPDWNDATQYRVKPTPKPDLIVNTLIGFKHEWKSPQMRCSWNGDRCPEGYSHNLDGEYEHIQYVFDGETGKLKSVSLIKE